MKRTITRSLYRVRCSNWVPSFLAKYAEHELCDFAPIATDDYGTTMRQARLHIDQTGHAVDISSEMTERIEAS